MKPVFTVQVTQALGPAEHSIIIEIVSENIDAIFEVTILLLIYIYIYIYFQLPCLVSIMRILIESQKTV